MLRGSFSRSIAAGRLCLSQPSSMIFSYSRLIYISSPVLKTEQTDERKKMLRGSFFSQLVKTEQTYESKKMLRGSFSRSIVAGRLCLSQPPSMVFSSSQLFHSSSTVLKTEQTDESKKMVRRSFSRSIVAGRLCLSQPPSMMFSSRLFHSSSPVHKMKCKKTTIDLTHSFLPTRCPNDIVQDAEGEMVIEQKKLEQELERLYSTKVDLRVFEDIVVKMEKGDEHKLSCLGRVSLEKNQERVKINFIDNPGAIKFAKLAIQKSLPNSNIDQQGLFLYIPTPHMTRERRGQLAEDAKGKMFNEYKKRLNEIYRKHDKKGQSKQNKDKAKWIRSELQKLKKNMEDLGEALIQEKCDQLLKEVV